jgi:hypothetical protein
MPGCTLTAPPVRRSRSEQIHTREENEIERREKKREKEDRKKKKESKLPEMFLS